jgi:hypothetical protein
MSVQKVTRDALHFTCPQCQTTNEIPFSSIRVYAREGGHCTMALPPCKCGARSDSVPSRDRDTPGHNVRRIAWKRAVAAGNFFDEESRAGATEHTRAFDAFYAAKGREALRALYEDAKSTVSLVEKKG